jgi:chemotaxis protein histidine kinase CheA/ActR/RegA family two-component response regulator
MLVDPKSTASNEWSVSTQTDLDNDIELQLQQELRSMFDVDTQQYLQNYVSLVGQLQAVSWTADIQELFRNVHTIKGGAVTVGADGLLYVATVLEDLLGDLRHLNPAPPLEDGQLGQLLLESGELLASSLAVWETGEAAQKAVQPAIDRIQSLRIQVKQIYLPDWNDQKRLHQEFAEQGFDLVVLDLELGLERLFSQGPIPDDLIESAQQTLVQLAEIGCDLEFAVGWSDLLEASGTLFDLQSAEIWRFHWPVYLKALKASAYSGGVATDFDLPEVSSEEDEGNHLPLLNTDESVSVWAETPEIHCGFNTFEPAMEAPDDFDFLSESLDSFDPSDLTDFNFDELDLDEGEFLENSEERIDLIAVPINDTDILEPIAQSSENDVVVPRHRIESLDIQIPIPLGRLDQTAQYLIDALLTARSSQGLHRALQEQLSQLFALAKDSTQYITRLRQLQDDYALLDAIKASSESDIESSRIPLERYRQGYSTLNRLLENSLRLSELGLEAEKKFLQTTANLQKLERNMVQLQQTVEQSRLVPFTKLAFRARAILRDLTNRLGKPAQLLVQGEHLDLDAGTLSKLEPLLLHLIRNAYDHGLEVPVERVTQGKPEQGTIVLSLQRRGNRFILDFKDDGRGINPLTIGRIAQAQGLPLTQTQTASNLLAVICQPGFSSQNAVTDVSGRGMGMDVVVEQVASLGGTLTLDTVPGLGTTFRLQFPVPHLLVPCVLLRSGDRTFAIPTEDIATTNILANLSATPVVGSMGKHTWQIQQGETIEPGIDFLDYWTVGKSTHVLSETAIGLAIRSGDSSSRIWILADEIIDKTDLLIKPLPSPLISPIGLLGLSLQPDGELIPVLETAALAECLKQSILPTEIEPSIQVEVIATVDSTHSKSDADQSQKQGHSILVVDDAALMRRRIEASLTASGYRVTTCNDGLEAWNWLQSHPLPALVITDIEMPNMDGFTLINRCRQIDIKIPMLVVSSRLAEEWYKEAQRLGASGYLTKGFSTSDLLDRVKSLMAQNQAEELHL